MGIYIKGMKMPKVCLTKDGYAGSCPMERIWCAQRYAPSGYTMGKMYADMIEKVPDWCPLVELPAPHGRLIDADNAIIDADERGYDFWVSDTDIDCAQEFLREQATVIEAEEI